MKIHKHPPLIVSYWNSWDFKIWRVWFLPFSTLLFGTLASSTYGLSSQDSVCFIQFSSSPGSEKCWGSNFSGLPGRPPTRPNPSSGHKLTLLKPNSQNLFYIYIYIQTLVLTFIYLFSSLGLVLFMISCWYIMCLSQNQICPCRCGKPHATYLFCWGMLGGCLLDAPSGEIGHQMGYGSFRSLPHDHRTKRTMKMVESYVSSCLLFAGSFTVCWW